MRRSTGLLLAFVLSTGLAACGGGDDPTVEVPAARSTTTTPTSSSAGDGPTTTVEADEAAAAATFGTSATIESDGYGQLVEVRHAPQDGFYRVVFEFEESVPGARVAFTDRPVVQDGSGDEISVAGDRVLLVSFEPASGFDMEASEESYTGPKRLEVEQAPVVEIVRVSDFEAHLDWAIGVDDGSTFRAFTLDEPARVVIDIRAVPDA